MLTPFLLTLLALAVVALGLLLWALSERTETRVVYKPKAVPRASGLAQDRQRLDAIARGRDWSRR